MKNSLLFLLLVGLSFGVYAQDLPMNEEGKIYYEEVVQVEGATKDQLYRQARKWFFENYEQGGQDEDVVYQDDSYLGEIGANPFLWLEVNTVGKQITAGAVLYEIKIAVKEGRYKYRIYSFSHESQGSRLGSGGALENKEPECGTLNMRQEYWDEIKTKTGAQMNDLIEKLIAFMATAPETGSSEEDW